MIGSRLRAVLRLLAWVFLVSTVSFRTMMIIGILLDPPNGAHWLFAGRWIEDIMEPIMLSGALLVLLSIDERIQKRDT